MNFPDPKQLKKLADACRKAGIKSFKCSDFEFALTDELPEKKAKKTEHFTQSDKIESDSLSEQDLLFWSVGEPVGLEQNEAS